MEMVYYSISTALPKTSNDDPVYDDEEDARSFFRRGVAGDWKVVFTGWDRKITRGWPETADQDGIL